MLIICVEMEMEIAGSAKISQAPEGNGTLRAKQNLETILLNIDAAEEMVCKILDRMRADVRTALNSL